MTKSHMYKITKNNARIKELREELELLYAENYRLHREMREGKLTP